jgi:cytochrome c oxidase subunit II
VDVLHSFYIPDFRTKKDAVPSRYTSLWFEAKWPGEFQVYCTEYCGDDHSRMTSKVVAMEPAAFREWVADKKNASANLTPLEKGQQLFATQGCAGCHSIDGSALIGPSLKGKYGAQESLADGSSVLVDDNYVRESILEPNAKIVAGFAGQMPPYQGRLQDDEISALIDYIKTLK